MIRSLALAVIASVLLAAAPAAADRGPAREAARATLFEAAGIEIAESAAQCRAKCEHLRRDCTGSQCRAAYAACISSCR